MNTKFFNKLSFLILGLAIVQLPSYISAAESPENIHEVHPPLPQKMQDFQRTCLDIAQCKASVALESERTFNEQEWKLNFEIKCRNIQLSQREKSINNSLLIKLTEALPLLYPELNPLAFLAAISFPVRKACWLLKQNPNGKTKRLAQWETKNSYEERIRRLTDERDNARMKYNSLYGSSDSARLRSHFFNLSGDLRNFLYPFGKYSTRIGIECIKGYIIQSTGSILANAFATDEDRALAQELKDYFESYDFGAHQFHPDTFCKAARFLSH